MVQATHNTLSENVRIETSELLNRQLAAAIGLHGQVKQAHWNVRGPTIIAVHELFDKVAGQAEIYSDLIAECAPGLGAIAEGTVQVATECSFLVPYRLRIADESQHLFASRRRLRCLGNRATPTRPISSPRYRAASTISSGSSNPMTRRDERNDRLHNGAAGQSRVSRKIITAPTASNSVSPRFGDDALAATSFSSVAARVNEGGAIGEVIR